MNYHTALQSRFSLGGNCQGLHHLQTLDSFGSYIPCSEFGGVAFDSERLILLHDLPQSCNNNFVIAGFVNKVGLDELQRFGEITCRQMHKKTIENTKKIPESAHRLIDQIFLNPVISISGLSKQWNISFNAVKKGVLRLVELGVLDEVGERKRNKLFVAPRLMELLSGSKSNK